MPITAVSELPPVEGMDGREGYDRISRELNGAARVALMPPHGCGESLPSYEPGGIMRKTFIVAATIAGALAIPTFGAFPASAAPSQETTVGGICLDKPGSNQWLPVTLTAKSFVKAGGVDVAGAPFDGRYKLVVSYQPDTFQVYFYNWGAGWAQHSHSPWLTTSGDPALECVTNGRDYDLSLI
jgi:hypothetical protein